MATVRRLASSLVSQIAAGEVVERPASALKELIENSLDAGASRCEVELEGGGITRLAVRDDGHGMAEADALLALERHTTSKIQNFDDLVEVSSFGFRGEALPSIASVSRLLLRTRAQNEDAGTEIVVEGGEAPSVRHVGAPSGTLVELRDLFFNVPARRKFLRSSATEAGHASEVVDNAALGSPGVTFTFTRDGRVTRQWLRAKDREERVRSLLAGETLARVRGQRGPLALEAYLSRPERATSGASALRLMVNNRPVKDRAVLMTIAQAYGSVLERGRYPRGVVYLDLPGELVDVNVHPQKAEVRLADHRAACDAIYQLISSELGRAFSLPASAARAPLLQTSPANVTAEPATPNAIAEHADRVAPTGTARNPGTELVHPTNSPGGASAPSHEVIWPLKESLEPLPQSDTGAWKALRFVAQLRETYLVCESSNGIYIIDQHAAAERVTFDRLRRQYRSRAVAMQRLLFPALLGANQEEIDFVMQHQADFSAFGLEVEPRGEREISVHAIPKLLLRANPETLLRDLLSEGLRDGRPFSDSVDLQLATMACHGSVRAGDKLTHEEATALLKALDHVDFAGHCPHGRPVLTCLSWNELERKVGRR